MNQHDIKNLTEKIRKGKAVIPGTWDPVFKSLMMNCKNYLTDIIYQVTKIPKDYIIENLILKNSEHPINRVTEKKGISDLIVEVKENHIILEMNASYYEGLIDKNLSYVEKLSIQNMKIGEHYPNRDKIIEINFDLEKNPKFPEDKKIIHEFRLLEKEDHFLYSDHFTIYHIDLEKIGRKYYNKEKRIDRFEKEMLLLMITDLEELRNLSGGDETMEEVSKKLENLSSNEELFTEYEREQMKRMEEEAIRKYKLEQAEKEGLAKGMQKGLEQGMKQGLEQGIQQGLDQGIEQGFEQGKKQVREQMIQKLKDEGIDQEVIAKIMINWN